MINYILISSNLITIQQFIVKLVELQSTTFMTSHNMIKTILNKGISYKYSYNLTYNVFELT